MTDNQSNQPTNPDPLWETATKTTGNQPGPDAWELLAPTARKLASPKARRRFEQDFLQSLAAYLVLQLEERNQRKRNRGKPIDLGNLPQFAFSRGRRRKPSLSFLILGQACLLLHKRGAKEFQAILENPASTAMFVAASHPTSDQTGHPRHLQ